MDDGTDAAIWHVRQGRWVAGLRRYLGHHWVLAESRRTRELHGELHAAPAMALRRVAA